jgi:POT family proton-dependent oligopeptide transporter
MGISALGALCLVGAALGAHDGQKASIGWVLGFELLNSVGFANVFPVGLALYARCAPRALAGTLVGVYYLHLFMANNLVGWLGGLLERLPGDRFWLLHVAMVGGSALVMGLAARIGGHLLGAGGGETQAGTPVPVES